MKFNNLSFLDLNYFFKSLFRTFLFFCLCFFSFQNLLAQDFLSWKQLPNLPPNEGKNTQIGLAGAFSGTHNGVLIIAGGANFPEKNFWQGGKKVWYDDIFILEKNHKSFEEKKFKLPKKLAYGTSISTPEGILCIGGNNSENIFANVFLLKWNPEKKAIEIQNLPPLPFPLAFAAGAKIGSQIYLAGGQTSLKNPESSKHFLALDFEKALKDSTTKWRILPGWKGDSRMAATAVAQSDGTSQNFYLFGGRNIDSMGNLKSLNDAFVFYPKQKKWKKIADISLPSGEARATIASVGAASGKNHILIYGGADGKLTDKIIRFNKDLENLKNKIQKAEKKPIQDSLSHIYEKINQTKISFLENNPGFPKQILSYHTITNSWTTIGNFPDFSPITSNAIFWNDGIVIPSGEIKHGIRTPKIWKAEKAKLKVFSFLDYLVILLYFLLLIWMGYYFLKKEKTTEDFFKASKKIPGWAAGLSLVGTSLSAISFMAVPAKTFATNWLYLLGSFAQLLVVPFVIYLFLPFFRRLDVTSAYEYLEKRFNLFARLIGAISFIIFQFGRIGIVLFLPAIALATVTGFDIYACIVVIALLSIFYTVLGGIEAVIWTDVIQVFVLMGGAIICLIIIVSSLDGGFFAALEIAQANGKLQTFDFNFDFTSPTIWVVLIWGFFANLITQTSDQTLIQRYLTTKDEKSAAKSLWIYGWMAIPVGLLFFALGTALYVFFKSQPENLNPMLENADAIFPWYIVSQLPNGVSGLLIAGIFAAAMSSLDSSMNSASAVITTDFYRRLKPNLTEKKYLNFARWITILMGLAGMFFAILMAGFEIKSLWDEFSKILGLFAGGLAGLFVLGILSSKANSKGAIVGFISSGIIQYFIAQNAGISFLLYSATGLLACILIGYLASWLFAADKKSLEGLTVFTIGNNQ